MNEKIELFDFLKEIIEVKSVTPAPIKLLQLIENQFSDIEHKAEYHNYSLENYLCGDDFSHYTKNLTYPVDNLFLTIGKSNGPHIAFCGHVDVVKAGDGWKYDPFTCNFIGDKIYARGINDMKGSIAAFVYAAKKFYKDFGLKGKISFLITCDEEGSGLFGMRQMAQYFKNNNINFDHILVGEPSSKDKVGDVIKIGRRGSINAIIKIKGKQGHVAYPHLARNPMDYIIDIAQNLQNEIFDNGNENFLPTNLEITSIDVKNKSFNVIPGKGKIILNCRFNNFWDGAKIKSHIENIIQRTRDKFPKAKIKEKIFISGDSFLSKESSYNKKLADAIFEITNIQPSFTTDGGTSDARFLHILGPICEFGPLNKTIHQVNENAKISDIALLSDIYYQYLKKIF